MWEAGLINSYLSGYAPSAINALVDGYELDPSFKSFLLSPLPSGYFSISPNWGSHGSPTPSLHLGLILKLALKVLMPISVASCLRGNRLANKFKSGKTM